MREMKNGKKRGKLSAYRCESCGAIQICKGDCDECGYEHLKTIRITRQLFCQLTDHVQGKRIHIKDKYLMEHFDR